MSANVESCFVVREPAWHGLGKVLVDAPTAAEAISQAGLDWEVKAKPIYIYGDEENTTTNVIPEYYANTRMTDKKVLGIVSGKYNIVQNREAFDFVDNLLDEGLTYESAGSLDGGRQIWLLGKMPSQKLLDDDLEPYICFSNRHDGNGAVKVCLTPVRVVCQNTLNLALSGAKRMWSTRHTGNMSAKLREAKDTLGFFERYSSALQEEAERLASIKVTDAEVEAIIDELYPVKSDDSNIKQERAKNFKDTFFACMLMPDILKYRNTAYGVMMAATDYADHSQPLRMTKSFAEKRMEQIVTGHPLVDKFYFALKK